MGTDVFVSWTGNDPENDEGFGCFHISSYPYELWKDYYKQYPRRVEGVDEYFPIIVLEKLIEFLEHFRFLRDNFEDELKKKYGDAIIHNTNTIEFDIERSKKGLQIAKEKFRSWISFL